MILKADFEFPKTYHFELVLSGSNFQIKYKLSNVPITISLLNYYGLYHSETINYTIKFSPWCLITAIEKYLTQLAHGGAT